MWKKILFLFLSFNFTMAATDPFDKYPHGIGGAEINVICAPTTVVLGQTFAIQINYTVDIVRPIDIHFDFLQEPEKIWLAGNMTSLDGNKGNLSLEMTLPDEFEGEYLWKVFITPRNESFPNMLAETGMLINFGKTIENACSTIPTVQEFVPSFNKDFVYLLEHDEKIDFLEPYHYTFEYGLFSEDTAEINSNIMDTDTNLLVYSFPSFLVEKTKNKTILKQDFVMGELFLPSHMYLDVSLIPVGKTWDDRLAEDRTYKLNG